jgi:crotonobetainyl-CoA:carnitine CoA-transferase CaiB-like acyl-CoA transferase
MDILQAAGVRAGAVQTAEDVNETDPQIAFRGTFFELDHPVIGEARFEGIPFQATTFAPDNWRSGPLVSEDSYYVFGELLGLSDADIDDLAARDVI